ncbi:MAG: DMT family transporter [Bacteroidales bacterium]|nr:DMT family transporter [Bacteroidales bacterium]
MSDNRQLGNSLLLTLTALIWGVAFVAQSEGSTYMGSSTFTGLRFLMAAAALWPVIVLSDRKKRRGGEGRSFASLRMTGGGGDKEGRSFASLRMTGGGGDKEGDGQGTGDKGTGNGPSSAAGISSRRTVWKAGIVCGALLAVASLLQQEGIAQGAGAGKAGFITATYIVLVPIVNLLLFRKRTHPVLWVGVAVALVGLYLLCLDSSLTFQLSDILLVLCALAFSFQILAVDRWSPRCDALRLAAIQFLTCGVLSSVMMAVLDIAPSGLAEWAAPFATRAAWIPLLYAAILSSAVGYTLQIVGQKGLNPTLASLLMSLESLFAAIAGWLILYQRMTPREILGAVLIFVAVLLAQLAPAKRSI